MKGLYLLCFMDILTTTLNLFLRWTVNTMLPPHGGAGESCTPRCRVKTLILSSQNYSPTSGMPLHLRWSRRNHTAERRRLLTKQTGKGTTKSVEPLLVQTSETSNKSRTSPDTAELALSQTNLTENSTISISSIVTVSVHNCFPETPIELLELHQSRRLKTATKQARALRLNLCCLRPR